ncbi:MAG: FtsX-like permease family protein, partial [Cyclobacteriaceae bacterium]
RSSDLEQLNRVFAYFSAIGILIACLGLFGFTYYVSQQRIKEIGIRKTLGASVANLISLMSTEFAIILIIGGAITIPLTYSLSVEWLSHYAMHVQPTAIMFILPVLIVGLLSFLSIIVLLIKAIKINPADSLKYE